MGVIGTATRRPLIMAQFPWKTLPPFKEYSTAAPSVSPSQAWTAIAGGVAVAPASGTWLACAIPGAQMSRRLVSMNKRCFMSVLSVGFPCRRLSVGWLRCRGWLRWTGSMPVRWLQGQFTSVEQTYPVKNIPVFPGHIDQVPLVVPLTDSECVVGRRRSVITRRLIGCGCTSNQAVKRQCDVRLIESEHFAPPVWHSK